MRRTLAIAALLAAPAAVDAGATVAAVLDAALGPATPFGRWSGRTPTLADVDGDGDLDVVAQNANGRVYVLDAVDRRILAELRSPHAVRPDLGPFNGPKAADLDGDGRVEVVNVDRAARLAVWTWRPPSEGGPELRFERRLDLHHPHPSADAGPVLADVDGDGDLDVLVQTEERGSYAVDADGRVLWSLDVWGGNAEAVARDLDGDGRVEVLFFTDDGRVHAVRGSDGSSVWSFDARAHGSYPASIPTAGLVDDLDGDGRVEVVVCTRNVDLRDGGGLHPLERHHFVLLAVRDGELLWRREPDWGRPLCAARLLAYDADGDGAKEIFGLDWDTVGHKPGDWERVAPSHAFAFRADGDDVWRRRLDARDTKKAAALADVDGDGRDEFLVDGRGTILALDPRTGATRARIPLSGYVLAQGPLVADLEGDGDLDAVVAVEGPGHAVLVIELGVPARSPPAPGFDVPIAALARGPPAVPAAAESPAWTALAAVAAVAVAAAARRLSTSSRRRPASSSRASTRRTRSCRPSSGRAGRRGRSSR